MKKGKNDMQRMSLRKFCRKYGASYTIMLDYCHRGLLPHSGGGKRGNGISIWDEDAIAFLRNQDKRQAEMKAAVLSSQAIAASIDKRRKNKNDMRTFKTGILEFKKEIQQLVAGRREVVS